VAPIIIVSSAGSFEEPASVPRPLLESCNAAFRVPRCVEASAAPPAERAFLAEVDWTVDSGRTVVVRVRGDVHGVPRSTERRLTFEPSDTLEERQRACGLVIAATVIALVTESPPPEEPAPAPAKAPEVVPQPVVPPIRSAPDRLPPDTTRVIARRERPAAVTLELIGGVCAASGLDAAGFRVGPMLGISAGPASAIWFTVLDGRLETAVSGPRSSATRLAAGLGLYPFGGDWARLTLSAELARLQVSAVGASGTEETERLLRFGPRVLFDVAVPVTRQLKLGWGVAVSALWPRYDLDIEGVGRGGEAVLGWSTQLGIRLRLN